jgi:hypothetical protein
MKPNYGGMTVNERLYVSGQWDVYFDAVDKRNSDDVVRILRSVEVDEESIQAILVQLGLDDS